LALFKPGQKVSYRGKQGVVDDVDLTPGMVDVKYPGGLVKRHSKADLSSVARKNSGKRSRKPRRPRRRNKRTTAVARQNPIRFLVPSQDDIKYWLKSHPVGGKAKKGVFPVPVSEGPIWLEAGKARYEEVAEALRHFLPPAEAALKKAEQARIKAQVDLEGLSRSANAAMKVSFKGAVRSARATEASAGQVVRDLQAVQVKNDRLLDATNGKLSKFAVMSSPVDEVRFRLLATRRHSSTVTTERQRLLYFSAEEYQARFPGVTWPEVDYEEYEAEVRQPGTKTPGSKKDAKVKSSFKPKEIMPSFLPPDKIARQLQRDGIAWVAFPDPPRFPPDYPNELCGNPIDGTMYGVLVGGTRERRMPVLVTNEIARQVFSHEFKDGTLDALSYEDVVTRLKNAASEFGADPDRGLVIRGAGYAGREGDEAPEKKAEALLARSQEAVRAARMDVEAAKRSLKVFRASYDKPGVTKDDAYFSEEGSLIRAIQSAQARVEGQVAALEEQEEVVAAGGPRGYAKKQVAAFQAEVAKYGHAKVPVALKINLQKWKRRVAALPPDKGGQEEQRVRPFTRAQMREILEGGLKTPQYVHHRKARSAMVKGKLQMGQKTKPAGFYVRQIGGLGEVVSHKTGAERVLDSAPFFIRMGENQYVTAFYMVKGSSAENRLRAFVPPYSKGSAKANSPFFSWIRLSRPLNVATQSTFFAPPLCMPNDYREAVREAQKTLQRFYSLRSGLNSAAYQLQSLSTTKRYVEIAGRKLLSSLAYASSWLIERNSSYFLASAKKARSHPILSTFGLYAKGTKKDVRSVMVEIQAVDDALVQAKKTGTPQQVSNLTDRLKALKALNPHGIPGDFAARLASLDVPLVSRAKKRAKVVAFTTEERRTAQKRLHKEAVEAAKKAGRKKRKDEGRIITPRLFDKIKFDELVESLDRELLPPINKGIKDADAEKQAKLRRQDQRRRSLALPLDELAKELASLILEARKQGGFPLLNAEGVPTPSAERDYYNLILASCENLFLSSPERKEARSLHAAIVEGFAELRGLTRKEAPQVERVKKRMSRSQARLKLLTEKEELLSSQRALFYAYQVCGNGRLVERLNSAIAQLDALKENGGRMPGSDSAYDAYSRVTSKTAMEKKLAAFRLKRANTQERINKGRIELQEDWASGRIDYELYRSQGEEYDRAEKALKAEAKAEKKLVDQVERASVVPPTLRLGGTAHRIFRGEGKGFLPAAIYYTFNPVLFNLTRRLWNGGEDLWDASEDTGEFVHDQAEDYLFAVDDVGRYGSALSVTMEEASKSDGMYELPDRLANRMKYDDFLAALGDYQEGVPVDRGVPMSRNKMGYLTESRHTPIALLEMGVGFDDYLPDQRADAVPLRADDLIEDPMFHLQEAKDMALAAVTEEAEASLPEARARARSTRASSRYDSTSAKKQLRVQSSRSVKRHASRKKKRHDALGVLGWARVEASAKAGGQRIPSDTAALQSVLSWYEARSKKGNLLVSPLKAAARTRADAMAAEERAPADPAVLQAVARLLNKTLSDLYRAAPAMPKEKKEAAEELQDSLREDLSDVNEKLEGAFARASTGGAVVSPPPLRPLEIADAPPRRTPSPLGHRRSYYPARSTLAALEHLEGDAALLLDAIRKRRKKLRS
jgi:hypothetical protein